jgi:hypothetical protein
MDIERFLAILVLLPRRFGLGEDRVAQVPAVDGSEFAKWVINVHC